MQKVNLTYASKSEHNLAQRFIIRTIEKLSGKRKLLKVYKKYESLNLDPTNFWTDILDVMDIKVVNKSKKGLVIPNKGPLIIISNHPYGIIDGIVLCSLVSKQRKDFKIITHETLQFLPELNNFILPINFGKQSKEIKLKNIETSKKAKEHLLNGGVLIVFPAGGVSVAKSIREAAMDEDWKLFPAKLIHQTSADVIPIYFEGKNGILFHFFASKMKNQTLKYSSYIHETGKKIGKEIEITSGNLVKHKILQKIESRKQLTNYLKDLTYSLKAK